MAKQFYQLRFTNRGQASKEQPYLAVLDLNDSGVSDDLAGHLRAVGERTGEDVAYLAVEGVSADQNGQPDGAVTFTWSSGQQLNIAA